MPSLLHTILLPLLLLRWNITHGFASIIASSSCSITTTPSSSSFPCRHHPHHHYAYGRYHDKRDSNPFIAAIRKCPNGWKGQIQSSRAPILCATARNNDDSSETTAKDTPSSSSTPLFFRVGIIGSGSIAYGTASLLASLGHNSMIWSPSGASAPKPNGMTPSTTNVEDHIKTSTVETVAGIQSTGAIEHNFNVRIAHSPHELVRCNDDVLIVALPANGHRSVIDTLSPVIVDHLLLARYAEIEAISNQDNEEHGKHSGRKTSTSSSPAMHIVISSHASLGAVYFLQSLKEECQKRQCTDDDALNENGILDRVRITAWGTTAVTARKTSDNSVRVLTVRQSVDYCTVPSSSSVSSLEEERTTTTTTTSTSTRSRNELLLCNDGYELCTTLFGPRFTYRTGGLLAISLSNLNPQNYLGIVLGNMSRMDPPPLPPPLPTTFPSLQVQSTSRYTTSASSFPPWYQGQNITPNIGRLMEALDNERIEIAKSLGIDVRTIHEHFSWSFHVPMETLAEDTDKEDVSITKMNDDDSSFTSRPVKPKMRPLTVSEMNQQMHHYLKNDVLGPTTPNSRYVLEDVPYGLVLTILLGKLTNKPAMLHEAGVQIISAMYGRNFMEENELLHGLGLLQIMGDEMIPSLDKWKEMANTGTFQDCERKERQEEVVHLAQ